MEKEARKYKKHKKGYTISVTYFLKKEKGVFERMFENRARNPITFPLHVRVAFLGQNVKIRSRIDVYISEEEYEDFINNSDIQQLIQQETESIKHAVKLFEPDQKKDFLISSWANFYKRWNEPLSTCLRESTTHRLETGLREEFQIPDTEIMNIILSMSTVYYESIDYYVRLKSTTAIRLQESLRSIIEMPNTAVVDFTSHKITFVYTYWDWKAGNYISALKRSVDSSTADSLTRLMSDYESLKTKE